MLKTISRRWKLALSLVLIAVFAAAIFFVTLSRSPVAIVSFTFDDASNSQYKYAFRISQKYNLPGTLFVPTEMVNMSESGEGYEWTMSWDKIREMRAAGWEIGSHSRTHTRLSTQTYDEVTDELLGSQQEIASKTGMSPVSFSSPFGNFNDEVVERIMEYYDYHLSWKGHGGRNPARRFDPRYIGRLEVTNNMTAASVCGEMVRAAQSNVWIVLLFHGIVEDDAGEYEVSADMFEQILQCTRFLEDQGLVRVETARDAAELLEWRRNLPFLGQQNWRSRTRSFEQ